MLGWINQILVGSTIEYGYYTDNHNYTNYFGWFILVDPTKKAFLLKQIIILLLLLLLLLLFLL